jgi:glutamine synthetase
MLLKPYPRTFAILPWRPEETKVARDIYLPDDTPFEGDPPYIPKNTLESGRIGF